MRSLAHVATPLTLLVLAGCAPRAIERPAPPSSTTEAPRPGARPDAGAGSSPAATAPAAATPTPGVADAPPAAVEPSHAEGTKLAIEVRDFADGPVRTATLECGAMPIATGFLTDAAAACAAVRAQREFLLHPPVDRACTMVYGGSQRGEIRGTVDGQPVRASIARTNGCGISDWAALTAVLGSPQGEP